MKEHATRHRDPRDFMLDSRRRAREKVRSAMVAEMEAEAYPRSMRAREAFLARAEAQQSLAVVDAALEELRG